MGIQGCEVGKQKGCPYQADILKGRASIKQIITFFSVNLCPSYVMEPIPIWVLYSEVYKSSTNLLFLEFLGLIALFKYFDFSNLIL